MKSFPKYLLILLAPGVFFSSCSTLEKASMHGFHSGFYKAKLEDQQTVHVYADVAEDRIDLYHLQKKQPEKSAFRTISLAQPEGAIKHTVVFKKQSLDIDLTAVPLKYRPSVYGLPGQLNTDFNLALYAGWRHDSYLISSRVDPLGRRNHKIINRGYDLGFFAGPATTLISPFTTQDKRADEYNGMTIQTGMAGFVESNIASFGLAVGWDYLLNDDRAIWIYQQKPWVGFIVGVALN
jgi:hypothetical protein